MEGSPEAVSTGRQSGGRHGFSTADYGMTPGVCAVSRIEPVSKMLPLSGMIIAGLIGIVFLADLAAGFPFQRVSIGLDVAFLVSAAIVGYLSWSLLEKARS